MYLRVRRGSLRILGIVVDIFLPGLMAWESTNWVAGRCLNPHNVQLSPGGSSGGEGAVVGSAASYLGIGSDIAGSIRLPSTVCGAYGLKPSGSRFVFTGSDYIVAGAPGGAAIPAVQGPLGRSVEDLELYTRVMCQPGITRFDASIIEIPYREVKLPAKLKLGYFSDNGACLPAPPVQAMIDDAVAKLKAAGHELVEYKPHDALGLHKLAFRFFDAYYGNLFKVIGPKSKIGDPFISAIAPDLDPLVGFNENDAKINMPMSELWDNFIQREIARHIWTQQFMELGLDGIICPTAGVPAPPHEQSGKMTPVPISYTNNINVMDWTAGVIPARTVSKADLTPYTAEPRNEMEKAVFEVYNANLDKYENSKCGLQVVGLRLQEEKVLEMMKVGFLVCFEGSFSLANFGLSFR
jgi:amidase